MTIAISTPVRNAMVDAVIAAIGSAGKVRLYNSTRPASGGTATTQLAELALANPAAPAAASGVATFSAITQDSSADATGTATWFRIVDGSGTFIIDGSITASGGGGDMELVTTSIVQTQPVQISSFTLTQGNA